MTRSISFSENLQAQVLVVQNQIQTRSNNIPFIYLRNLCKIITSFYIIVLCNNCCKECFVLAIKNEPQFGKKNK